MFPCNLILDLASLSVGRDFSHLLMGMNSLFRFIHVLCMLTVGACLTLYSFSLFLIRIACLLNVYSVWFHLPQKVVPFNYDWSNMLLTPRRALTRLYHDHLPRKICVLQSKYNVFHINRTDRSYDLATGGILGRWAMSQRAYVMDCTYL